MYQLLRDHSERFADIGKSEVTRVLRGYSAEDWFRAFSLL